MIRTEIRLRLCTLLTVLLLVFIWGNSLLPAQVSQAFSDWVKSILEKLLTGSSAGSASGGVLRKIAHFMEFAALGMCLCWRGGMLKRNPLWPISWGVAAACIDETIQLFVPGRGPALKDVLIDSCGVAAGIILVTIGHSLLIKRSTKKQMEDNSI